MFGHTRHFPPQGYGVKINHYFPGKDSHQESTTTEQEPTPVSEKEDLRKDNKVEITSEIAKEVTDKMASFESIKTVEKESTQKVQTSKIDILTTASLPKLVSSEVSTTVQNEPERKPNGVIAQESMPKALEKAEMPVEKVNSEEDKQSLPDSDVASSYYNSRFYRYFIGY